MTGEDLTLEDLVELKSSRTVRPRPPTLTSIPSLLGIFQNEWDALALETFTLRQHLTQTRQELSRALYEHDAAVRVITRLSRERDEAREALSKITVNGSTATNGDAMQVDGQGLSEELVATVQSTQERYAIQPTVGEILTLTIISRLSKTRRKRVVPEEWATSDTIQSFAPLHKSKSLYTGARTVSLDASGDLALLGGSDGSAGVFSISQNKLVQEFSAGSSVTDTLWAASKAIVGTSAGTVKVFENGTEVSSFSGHAGEVTGLALHASGEILASVGVDKSYILYDLSASTQVLQIYTDSGKPICYMYIGYTKTDNHPALTSAQFHPDGHLLAAGGVDGQIRVFETKTGDIAAIFDASGPVRAISFSENGIWLASVVQGSTSATIWDLRKAEETKVLEIGGQIDSVHWDYTGQFLATAGPSGITAQQYSKSAKAWSEPLKSAVPAVDAVWGSKARNLVSLDQGILTVLGPS